MDLATLFEQFGISLGLGLLVGVQRERVESRLAGFRTFPLISLLGTLSAHLAQETNGWVLVAGFLALTGLIAVGNALKLRAGHADPGLTTEVAMLLLYGVGAYLVVGSREVAIALGGGVAVLLHFKPEMHRFAGRIGDADFRAVMRFALISLVILPVLPDQTYGPYDVLNPYEIWLMVVLIVGMGLGGYLGYKVLGSRAGTLLAGVLGGLISSTATTVTYARRSARAPQASRAAALVVLMASSVVFVRVLVEIAVVAPAFLPQAAGPMAALMAAFLAISAVFWLQGPGTAESMPEQENPAELKPALVFGFLYALVLLAVAAARNYLGEPGLYAVAALSGLTDMDAITLSTAQLVNADRLDAATGWRLIVVASLSNLVFKGAMVAVLGHRRLLGRIAVAYAVVLAVGALLLVSL